MFELKRLNVHCKFSPDDPIGHIIYTVAAIM